jgi:hypothetical protein
MFSSANSPSKIFTLWNAARAALLWRIPQGRSKIQNLKSEDPTVAVFFLQAV